MTIFILIAIVAVVTYFFWPKKTGANHQAPPGISKQQTSRPVVYGFQWPALDEYEFEVVGESFYQNTLQRLAGEHNNEAARVCTTATLVPENDNKHDDKAVRVDIEGHTVGYLQRDEARSFRRRLGAKKLGASITSCGARIMGGFTDKHGKKASYGVRLDIKPFNS